MNDRAHDCLGLQVGSAFRRIDRLFNRGFAEVGLAHAHAQVLLSLLREGETRMTTIARQTGFEQSTVSRLTRELARKRLVLKRKDPEDARSRILRPSMKARRLQARLERIEQRLNDRLRRELSADDLRGLLNATEVMGRLP